MEKNLYKIINKQTFLILFFILCIAGTVFVYSYVKNESPIYIFDYSGYHQQYITYSSEILDKTTESFNNIIESIKTADYNCTSILGLLPFYFVFNSSRFGYILGLTIMYLIPTIFLITYLMTTVLIFKDYKEKNEAIIIISILTFFYTRLWSPTLRGLSDIIGLIPMILATIIFTKHRFLKKQRIYIPIGQGILIYLMFLFRRWYVYSVISMFASMFLIDLLEFIKAPKREKVRIGIINYSIAATTTLILTLTLQFPLVKTILSSQYSEQYSAYQRPLLEQVSSVFNEFGIIVIIGAILGFIYTIINKEYREYGIFCISNIFIFSFAFTRVQAMGLHHFYGISLYIWILFVFAIYGLCKLLRKKILKIILIVFITFIIAINFATTYIYRKIDVPIISQKNKYYKFFYENYSELTRLISDLEIYVSNGKRAKISAFASSEVLSDNLLELLGTENVKRNIVYTSHIDLRDGLNFNSLMSEYVVVTDIPQTGTSNTGQRIIEVPDREILNGTSIGKAYVQMSGPYILKDNVKAYIYRKARVFEESEINEYMDLLYNYYPEWKETYNQFDFSMLRSEITLGENAGEIRREDKDTIYIAPGDTKTYYKMKIDKKLKSIKLKAYIDKRVETDDELAGDVLMDIYLDNYHAYNQNVKLGSEYPIELNLEGVEYLEFEVDKNMVWNYDYLFIDIISVEEKM